MKISKEQKANQIVKLCAKFIDKEVFPDIKIKYPNLDIEMEIQLKEIFLVGAWYGSFKTLQMQEIKKCH